MTPHLKPREQGDLGEFSAMQWFAEQGAHIYMPFGHSPDVDFVAVVDGRPLQIEVKTSTSRPKPGRWLVHICTAGGNQSWNGLTKYFDPARCDYLFAHVGDGRRWLIPTNALECRRALTLGGPKYSEFEIDSGRPLRADLAEPSLDSRDTLGEYPSGQRMAPVKRRAKPSQVRILPPPSPLYERAPGAAHEAPAKPSIGSGIATIYPKRRTTVPEHPFVAAGLSLGDVVRFEAITEGRMTVTRVGNRQGAAAHAKCPATGSG